MSIPTPPSLGFSFTDFSTNNPSGQQPGVSLDAEFNRGYAALSQLIQAVRVSVNADGTLSSAAVQAAYEAGSGGGDGGGTNIADAPSALSALLSQAWAEYMPDQLPAETLAGTGITGDHYSARWWANQAALTVTEFQAGLAEQNALLTVHAFDTSGTYPIGSLVSYLGIVYQAKALVSPGVFNAANWTALTTTPVPVDAAGALTNDGNGVLSWTPAVPLAGGTMTGALTLPADPTSDLQAATKQYADLAVKKAGGTMTGLLLLSGAPTVPLHAATKAYVDAADAAETTARTTAVSAEASARTTADALALPKAGGTMTGTLAIGATGKLVMTQTGGAAAQPAMVSLTRGTGSTATDAPVLDLSAVLTGANASPALNTSRSTTTITGAVGGAWANYDTVKFQGPNTISAAGGSYVTRYMESLLSNPMGGGANSPQAWAAIAAMIDETGLPSSQAGLIRGMEIDVEASGLDDHSSPPGGRVILSLVGFPGRSYGGTDTQISAALDINQQGGSSNKFSFKRFMNIGGTYSVAGIDLSSAVPVNNAPVIILPALGRLWMDTGGTNYIASNGVTSQFTGAWEFVSGATLRITGNVGFYGTPPQTKPAITGSRGGNAALASLLGNLAALGLLTDSTTA